MAASLFATREAAVLGEGPVWDQDTGRLHSLDCMSRRMTCHAASGTLVAQWQLPRTPGSYALRERGGLLMAYRRGLALVELEPATLRDVPTPEIDFGREIFNDGKCDRRGRFWVGTMDRELAGPVGALYRVDPDLSVTRMDGGVTLSNGIAWSPDDRTMYFCDSRPGRIWAYDYDIETGSIANRRLFADFAGRRGRPDGCTIDSEGGLWVAEINAGQVVRFGPDGTVSAVIETPVSKPTSVAFGGSGLRTLFVTSMKYGLSDDELARQPHAGCVLGFDVGVAGLPEPRFAG